MRMKKKKTLLETYALSVCFAAMICISVSLGIIIYDIVQINYPEVTIEPHRLDMPAPPPPLPQVVLQSGMATAADVDTLPPEVLNPPPPAVWGGQLFADPAVADKALSQQELDEIKEKRIEWELNNEKSHAKHSLIRMSIILLVAGVVFLIHWRLAKRCSI